ncbi:MAG TPA: T9SS type A sorting domain-containing protein, partial [Bacteroidia bacterium]|nr:T9SS type A sorting domain-containing protein [Bacteroidia bacterium]
TFEFYSDFSVTGTGWVTTFDCVPCANGPNGTDNSDCLIGSPICSDQSFSDASTGPGIVSDGGNGCVLSENFSNWYKLTVSTGGTLGLTIVPNVATDDYDFALYQTSNCGSLGSPVRCSYASNTGNTGMNNANNLAVNTAICGPPNNGSDVAEDVCGNGWVNDLAVTPGQNFYLLVNKWTPGGSGFTLDWSLSGGASLNCSVLPVELISFQAIAEEKIVRLNWTTSSEINNQYFTVERSADGIDFEPIQMVDGAGSTTSIRNYETLDEKPLHGISYYRLKQTDFDGKFSYSDKVPVDFSDHNDIFYLHPNPAGEAVSFIFSSEERTTYNLQIFSTDGVCCFKKTIDAIAGMNKSLLDISIFQKGVYFVILEDESSHRVTRLVHH